MWPKNMEWIGSRCFSADQHVQLDGWDCSFLDPRSLLPSTNTASAGKPSTIPWLSTDVEASSLDCAQNSVHKYRHAFLQFTNSLHLPFLSSLYSAAELLLHFFRFYAEVFPISEQAVAIHTLTPPLHSQLRRETSGQTGPQFRVSSLCVQDPFEHSHNVTKNVGPAHLRPLLQALQSSLSQLADLLDSEQSTPDTRHDALSLFRLTEPSPVSGKKAAAMKTLHVDISTASRLLHGTCYAALANCLQELDLHNLLIQHTLDRIILHSLAQHLEREFGFKVQTIRQQEAVSASITPYLSPGLCPSLLDKVYSAHHRKRQRMAEEGEGEGEEGMEMEEEGGGESGESGECEGVKRKRQTEQGSAEQLLFELTAGEECGSTLECSAIERNWIGRRRKRRMHQGQASSSCEAVTEEEAPPCLSFLLSSSSNQPPSDHFTTISLQVTEPMYQESFLQFFAVCKKWLFSHPP